MFVVTVSVFFFIQRLPNGPSSILDDGEIDRQREGEIERQRAELGQLKERLALMCRQVLDSETLLWYNAFINTNKVSQAGNANRQEVMCVLAQPCIPHSQFPSGRGDRGAADVCQEGAGPFRGDQPETTEGCERGETR